MWEIDSRIVDVCCDYGGKYVSEMLENEGVFDRPELEIDSNDVWWDMFVQINEFQSVIKKRSPTRYSVPRRAEFMAILKVMDAAAAVCVQSTVFVAGPGLQEQGHLVLAKVILDTLRSRECDRSTGLAFLTAVAQALDESEFLILKLRASSQGRPTIDEIESLIQRFSQGPLAEVIAEDAQASMVEAWR